MEFDSRINSLSTTNHLVGQIGNQLEELKRKAMIDGKADLGGNQLGKLEVEESDLSSRCSNWMEELQRQETEMVGLDNRISLLQTRVAISEKQVEYVAISSQIERVKSVIGTRSFDPEQLRTETRTVLKSVQGLREERSRMEGESSQVGNQVREIESKLASFFDIDERFRQAMIQFETESLVAKDIARYHQALDRALMNYHVSKMNEINAVIRELWERVYKGTDIDFIAIRSDTEGEEEAGGVVAAKRSYNYRVVMVKGDVELEMRGRCSAGQKVLSCLIIRLALAESFCVNCGILALDEPTTNLDRANIGGLAEALAELIESRRNQRNFQLIIITHDESFVRMLGRLHACENFYRVRKDDYGHSTISRSAIYELNATA
jgi:DNA repair protein RAD50